MVDADELLRGAARDARRAAGDAEARAAGAIVNVASVNAFFEPDAGVLDYGAAKAALVNLTKSLARSSDRAASGSTPSRPGRSAPTSGSARTASRTRSPRRPAPTPSTARKKILASIGGFPTGRFTTPEEVATLVVLLASQRTGNVTGSNFVIDGGLIKTT